MTKLPPFSGDRPRCRKCGVLGAHTEWQPRKAPVYDRTQLVRAAEDEHLRRSCIRCGYRWREDIVRPV